jgi:hypothetical protein
MFGRGESLWRRLFGLGRRPADAEAEDRRAWGRQLCDLETTYLPADAPEGPPLSARVQDVSRGGISLRTDRPYEPGRMLCVQLPGGPGEPTYTVLVCVIHATPKPDGWVVGCTFSSELSDTDLQAFGARREKPTPPDNRTWVRFHAVNLEASCRLAMAPDEAPRPARVLDLSANGAGLLVDRPVPVGSLLTLEMRSNTGPTVLSMLACVVRSAPRDKGWALGCNFISELSDRELQALL